MKRYNNDAVVIYCIEAIKSLFNAPLESTKTLGAAGVRLNRLMAFVSPTVTRTSAEWNMCKRTPARNGPRFHGSGGPDDWTEQDKTGRLEQTGLSITFCDRHCNQVDVHTSNCRSVFVRLHIVAQTVTVEINGRAIASPSAERRYSR
jgi:hypothetical protein